MQACSQRRVQARCRTLLDQLLVAPLHRAVPLAQMRARRRRHRRAPALRHADRFRRSAPGTRARRQMPRRPRPRPYPLQQPGPRSRSTRFMPRPPPPPTALISSGTPICAARRCASSRVAHGATGHHGHCAAMRLGARAQLVAHGIDLRRRGSDEADAIVLAQLREGRALGQEAVARMNGIAVACQRRLHDGVHVEVGIRGSRWADADRAIGQPRGQRIAIGFRNRQHGLDAQAVRRCGSRARRSRRGWRSARD